MERILLLYPIIIYRRLYMPTVPNYSTAGFLVGKWSFTLKIIITWFLKLKSKVSLFSN